MLTDIATGWTECAPLLVREQTVLTAVLDEMRTQLPVAVRGFDTDNDTVFLNETVLAYCQRADVEFTRCRPYRKNDQMPPAAAVQMPVTPPRRARAPACSSSRGFPG